VKMKHCWNCWQLHYQGFCYITIIKFSITSLFSLWSSSWCSSKLSSQWSSCVASTCFLSYPPCILFFSLLDPYVPNRFPFPSPILCHWCSPFLCLCRLCLFLFNYNGFLSLQEMWWSKHDWTNKQIDIWVSYHIVCIVCGQSE